MFRHDLLEPLAAKLAEVTPGAIDTFFFANSGAEITEAAVKLAKQATGRPNVIVFHGSFHGRTHLTMAMTTSKTVYRAGHAPLPVGRVRRPVPRSAGRRRGRRGRRCARRLRPPPAIGAAPERDRRGDHRAGARRGWLRARAAGVPPGLVERCRAHGILFVADEVQSGFCRTGRFFAIEHYDIEPDVICMAKGIASGFPFAALGTRRELDDRWPKGSHGGTYGGNAIGCAAALATIEVMQAPGFLDNVNAPRRATAGRSAELQHEHPDASARCAASG